MPTTLQLLCNSVDTLPALLAALPLLLAACTADGSVSITCSKGNGWTTGVWDLKVKATVKDGPCNDDDEKITTVTVNSKPTVTVTGEATKPGCSQGPVVLEYTVTVSGGNNGSTGAFSAPSNVQAAVTGDTATGVSCGNPVLKPGEKGPQGQTPLLLADAKHICSPAVVTLAEHTSHSKVI